MDAGAQQAVDDRERKDKAGADRLQVEGGATGDAEPGLHRDRGRREGLVGRRSCQHDQIDRARLELGVAQRRARGGERKVGGQFARRGDMALADAGALHDPFVGGLDRARQIVVGEDVAGQIAAAAEHDRTHHRHEPAPLASRAIGLAVRARPCSPILASKLVAHHVVADIDGRGEALGVGAAMALDDDAVEAEEDAAVGFARIHLLAQRLERRARQQIAEPRRPGAVHGAAQILRELARGAFRGLERDIAGEAFGHHHVDRALADIVAFDEAVIVEMREMAIAQNAPGLAHLPPAP